MQTGEHEGVLVAGKVNKPAIMNNNRLIMQNNQL
jgi:hypothetical protein